MKPLRLLLIASDEKTGTRNSRIIPLAVFCFLFVLAGLAVVSGIAGYNMYSLCMELTRTEQSRQKNTDGSCRISEMSQKIAMLDEELSALRDYNRRLREISRMNTGQPGVGMNGMGGSGPVAAMNDEATDILTKKSLSSELYSHIKRLSETIAIEQDVSGKILAEIERQHSIMEHAPCIWPAQGSLSSSYGWRVSPFTGKREFHFGIDIASDDSAPIYAPADGIIASYNKSSSMGNVMEINHGYGIVTRYCHLHNRTAGIGQHVKKGDMIAFIGNTGRSTGPHLHYEVIINGINVNPQRYLLK